MEIARFRALDIGEFSDKHMKVSGYILMVWAGFFIQINILPLIFTTVFYEKSFHIACCLSKIRWSDTGTVDLSML